MVQNSSRRRVLRVIGPLLVTGTLAGCSAPSAGDGNDGDDTDRRVVEMSDDLVFDPDELAVSNGGTVVWENGGSVEHSVTAYADQIPDGAAYFASGGFDSEQAARDGYPEGSIAGGESFEHTFETTGTYEYFCIPHEGAGMTGTIEVA